MRIHTVRERSWWFLGVALVCSNFNLLPMNSEPYTSRIQNLQRTLLQTQENPGHVALRATRPIATSISLVTIPEQANDHHLKTVIEIIRQYGWEIITPRMQEQIALNGWQNQIITQVGHAPPIKNIPRKANALIIAGGAIALGMMAGCDFAYAYCSIAAHEWEKQPGLYDKYALIWSRTYLTKFLNRLR